MACGDLENFIFISILVKGYVDTVGRNKIAIQKYIKNQMQEDLMADQISLTYEEVRYKENYGLLRDVETGKIQSRNDYVTLKIIRIF